MRPDALPRALRVELALARFARCATVLQFGAHPDDEDSGLFAYLAYGEAARMVYWSATRGEGGQDFVGERSGAALGVVRTWESLDARAIDGAEALFGHFIDFGYSKSAAETWARWGRDQLIEAMVRAIRAVQPTVIVSRWSGAASDEHGHHKAVGLLAREAWQAAAAPGQFAEHAAIGLPAWRAARLYYGTEPDAQPGQDGAMGGINAAFERPGYAALDTGRFDPRLGMPYQAIGSNAINSHRSQGIGVVPRWRSYRQYLRLDDSLLDVAQGALQRSLFEALPAGLADMADYPGLELDRTSLAEADSGAQNAIAGWRAGEPLEVATSLAQARGALERCRQGADATALQWLSVRLQMLDAVLADAMALRVEAVPGSPKVFPGASFELEGRLHQPLAQVLGDQLKLADVAVELPPGWSARALSDRDNETGIARFEVAVPSDAALSRPHWLASDPSECHYAVPLNEASMAPLPPACLRLRYDMDVAGERFSVHAAPVRTEPVPGGFREVALQVQPPVVLQPLTNRVLIAVNDDAAPARFEVSVTARCNADPVPSQVEISAIAPDGWQIEPRSVAVSFAASGEEQRLRFNVRLPADAGDGQFELGFAAQVDGGLFDTTGDVVRTGIPGIPRPADDQNVHREMPVPRRARIGASVARVRFQPGYRYAWLAGTDVAAARAMTEFGVDITLLDDSALLSAELDAYEAIIVGVNAYVMRATVARQAPRLLEYVARGGTLIVMHQGYAFERLPATPHPFSFNQPHDRVTDAGAPVQVLMHDAAALNEPNRITEDDFEGWQRDRGMYFFGNFDRRYQALLELRDGEGLASRGALLVTSHGRGSFVYTGLSFFRQLPAGVPGAVRLFANLLALPAVRLRERAAMLARSELFAALPDDALQAVARRMTERWCSDGEVIAREGEPGYELFLVAGGAVSIWRADASADAPVHVAQVGEVVGELSVLTDMPRRATVRAQGECDLIVVRGEDFRAVMRKFPEVMEQLMGIVVRRMFPA